jgi:hypothetical protein
MRRFCYRQIAAAKTMKRLLFILLFLIWVGLVWAASATDNFTGSDGDDLNVYGAWACGYTDAYCPAIGGGGNYVYNNNISLRGVASYTGFTPTDNQAVRVEIAVWTGAGQGEIGPAARMAAPPDQTYYSCKAHKNESSFTTTLQLRVAGVATFISSENATSWGVGDSNRIEVSDGAQACLRNGSLLLTGTDTVLTSGRGGIVLRDNTNELDTMLDNFFVEDLAAAATVVRRRPPVFQ